MVGQRAWKIPGQRTKRLAWGFSITVDGKRTKQYRAEWTREDAQAAEAKALLGLEEPQVAPVEQGMTFGAAVEQYLKAKVRKKSLDYDRQHLGLFKVAFGVSTPLTEITTKRINAWRAERLGAVCAKTGKPYSAAAVNRPLAALRHLLKLAAEEGTIEKAPTVRMEKEPEGKLRWLTEDEIARLLNAWRQVKEPRAVRRCRRRDQHRASQGRAAGARLGARGLQPQRHPAGDHEERQAS